MKFSIKDFFSKLVTFTEKILNGKLHILCSVIFSLKDFITLIPLSEWSADYLKPFELCYMKKKYCQDNIKFHLSPDSTEATAHKSNPANPLTKAVHATSEVSKVLL